MRNQYLHPTCVTMGKSSLMRRVDRIVGVALDVLHPKVKGTPTRHERATSSKGEQAIARTGAVLGPTECRRVQVLHPPELCALGEGLHRLRSSGFGILGALAVAACGGAAKEVADPPWSLRASLGAYDDGSGRLGIAFLQTLRNREGLGAGGPWNVTLRHESGLTLDYVYDASGPGSYEATWSLETAPLAGRWEIDAVSGSAMVRGEADLGTAEGLAPPVVGLRADGLALEWPAVPGAAAYLCRVFTSGALQLEALVVEPGCDLSLPAGAYSASILALSFDPRALLVDAAASPTLPSRFDISEARIGFTRVDGAVPVRTLRAVGGAYDNGVGPRSIAVWLSLANADGSLTSSDWRVEIVGPGIPAESPLTATYWAGFPRLMVWAVGVNATVGTYTATATSGGEVAVAQFTVGAPVWLGMPSAVVASDGAQGSAAVSWNAVTGSVNYLASAYDAVTGELVASQWTPVTHADFPAGTFAAGRSYDVFVAASDVDMVGGAIPTQASVAENVFDYSTFLAR